MKAVTVVDNIFSGFPKSFVRQYEWKECHKYVQEKGRIIVMLVAFVVLVICCCSGKKIAEVSRVVGDDKSNDRSQLLQDMVLPAGANVPTEQPKRRGEVRLSRHSYILVVWSLQVEDWRSTQYRENVRI